MRNVPDRGGNVASPLPRAGNVAGSEASNLAASGNVAAVLATFTLVNVATFMQRCCRPQRCSSLSNVAGLLFC